jgi:hypothetical protein
MGVDYLREVILWLKVILFDSLAQTLKIRIENHFTESGEDTFFLALSLLIHFRESLHKISRESLLSKKTIWQSFCCQQRISSRSSAKRTLRI